MSEGRKKLRGKRRTAAGMGEGAKRRAMAMEKKERRKRRGEDLLSSSRDHPFPRGA
jgi:hypothetical protein